MNSPGNLPTSLGECWVSVGPCPRCGLYCKDHLHECEAECIAALQDVAKRQSDALKETHGRLARFKKKCPTCRCRILPGVECMCCADRVFTDEDVYDLTGERSTESPPEGEKS